MFNILNSVIWSIAVLMLIGGGIFFSIYLGFKQFDFKGMIKSFKNNDSNGITSFQSLSMALAARIGVGSLAGIALSIYLGGIGTMFWIWISSIITSINSYCESILGSVYQEKDDNVYKGGPSYYIDYGLNNKSLARVYALIVILAYIIGFLAIQSNTISKSVSTFLNINPILIGIIVSIFTGFIIFNGVKKIASFTSKLVPIMGIIYLLLSIFIIVKNISLIPNLIILIVRNAFDFKSLGFGIISSFIIGIQRGVFSTEAGLGSGAIASSLTHSSNPSYIGLVQVVGIYFVSFIICTSTAFIILTSDYININFTNINGIEITQYALSYHLGSFGNIILLFSIIAFAFSTIVSGYYYGESNLKYLFKSLSNKHLIVLKIVTLILLIVGSAINSSYIWYIVDLFVAFMAIINMYALFKLRKEIKYYTYKKY